MACISSAFTQDVGKDKKTKRRYNNQLITLGGGDSNRTNGGYISINSRYSKINDLSAIQVGAKTGWIAGHFLAMGVEANAFLNDYNYDLRLDKDYNLSGGYGGFFIEPIILPRFPVHLSFPIHFGVGRIGYGINEMDENWNENWIETLEALDNFILFEPGVELEINLVKFCRLCFGLYYKFTSDIDLRYEAGMPITPTDVLDGFSGGFSIKFGKF